MGTPPARYDIAEIVYKGRTMPETKGWVVYDTHAEVPAEIAECWSDGYVPYVTAKDTGEWFCALKKDRVEAKIEARRLSIEDWKERGIDPATPEQRIEKARRQAVAQPALWGTW